MTGWSTRAPGTFEKTFALRSGTSSGIRRGKPPGVITGYRAEVDAESVGLGLTAFVFVRSNEVGGSQTVGARLTDIPEAIEVHNVAGEDCFLIKLRTATTGTLRTLLSDRIGDIPGITGTRTVVVLGTEKETCAVPIPDPADD